MKSVWRVVSLVSGLSLGAVALTGCPGPVPGTDAGDAAGDILAPRDAQDATTSDATTSDATDVTLTDATDGATPVDAQDAAVDGEGDGGTGACTLRRVVVTTTDFATGGYVTGDIATRTLRTVSPPAMGMGPAQDHVVRTSGCIPFDLWRTFASAPNHIVVLDPDNLNVPRRTIPLDVVATGPDGGTQPANPYDIAVISPTRAYVTQYNSPRVLIVNPALDGAAARVGSIDLSPLADSDGIPEADAITVVGTRAYVSLQQLDRTTYTPPARSTVAVIDTTTDALIDTDPVATGIQGIRLTFGNPTGRMPATTAGLHLVVSSGGNAVTPAAEGGIDVIDLNTFQVVRSFAGSDAILGGDPGSVEIVGPTRAWVSVNRSAGDAGTNHVILEVDVLSGTFRSLPIAESATVTWGSLRRAPDGNIWAIDAGFGLSGSVHVFAPSGTVLLTTPFATPGVNTYSLDFVP